MEPSTHGRLWTGAHRLFGAVEHLQLASSYGLFRRMSGLGGRPEVVLEGSYDGHHWTVSAPAGACLGRPAGSVGVRSWGDPATAALMNLAGYRRSSSCTSPGM